MSGGESVEAVVQIAKMLRRRKVRMNVARAALAEYEREDRTKPGQGSLAASIVITTRMHNTPAYRKAVRSMNWNDRLIRWGLRTRKPGRPIEEIFADARAKREGKS